MGEGEWHVGEDEDEALVIVAEGLEDGDDAGYAVIPERGEDLGLTMGVVRFDVVRFDDDLESAGFGTVDLGRYAAGNVMAVLVGADGYPEVRLLLVPLRGL